MNTNQVWRATARENGLKQSIFVLSYDFEVFLGLENNQKHVGYNCFSLPLLVLLWRTFFRIGNLSKYNIFGGKTHLNIYQKGAIIQSINKGIGCQYAA